MENSYPKLSDASFAKLSHLLYKNSGIKLKENKKYLLIHRLSKVVGPTHKFKDFDEYLGAILSDQSGHLMVDFMNLLTTNWTFFFRENVHFDFLKEELSRRAKNRDYIRLWSAACSTGEEPYSMAISILQSCPEYKKHDIKILATDISTRVLNFAKEGIYHYTKVRGHVEDSQLKRFFTFDRENNDFLVKPEVSNLIAFRYLNLFESYPFKLQFDIVFLRNVLIYFQNREKEEVIRKISDYIKPGGYLVTGLSESLVGINHKLKMVKNSIYHKN